jgi:hypothetical protein
MAASNMNHQHFPQDEDLGGGDHRDQFSDSTGLVPQVLLGSG